MIDLSKLKEDRECRHSDMMESIPKQSDGLLFRTWAYLKSKYVDGTTNEYTDMELEAVVRELDRRGYVDELGQVITPKRF